MKPADDGNNNTNSPAEVDTIKQGPDNSLHDPTEDTVLGDSEGDPSGATAQPPKKRKRRGPVLPDFPVLKYAFINFLLVIWGLIGLFLVVSFHLSQQVFEDLITAADSAAAQPAPYLYIGCSVTFCVGIAGIIYAVCRYNVLFYVPPYFNGAITALYLLAIISALSALKSHSNDVISESRYQRILEATTLPSNDSHFKILGRRYKSYWERLQTELRCCGWEGPDNWIQSECNCVPSSCCDKSKRDDCKVKAMAWHDTQDFAQLKQVIWHRSCKAAILDELEDLEYFGWTFLSAALLYFHLILAVIINSILFAARNRFNLDVKMPAKLPKIKKISKMNRLLRKINA